MGKQTRREGKREEERRGLKGERARGAFVISAYAKSAVLELQ
jgi:hypothetical protein